LGVPVVDALFVKITQVLQGKNPAYGTRTFLHHRMLDAGWSKPKIALFYWSLSAILGVVALFLGARQKLFALLALGVFVLMIIIWLNFYTSWLKPPESGNG
jgi:uncharacterized membrane protein YphA (DoxX/SURF4 family)